METVTLYHGTTRSAAESISKHGWQPRDALHLVDVAAADHGIDATRLHEVLTERGRFVVVQRGRSASAWFASSHDAAMRWAQRAPEARWEALWGVWLLRHEVSDEWFVPWADPEASAWHLRQRLADPPVVVTVEVPISRLQDAYQRPVPTEDMEQRRAMIATGRLAEVSVVLPVPASWITNSSIVPRHVSFTEAAGLFGTTVEKLSGRVQSGQLAEPRPGPPLQDWYWHYDDLREPLTEGTDS